MAQTNVQAFSGDVAISSNLAVDTNTLFVDSVANKVGIGNTSPATYLHLSAKNSDPGASEGDGIGTHTLTEYLRFTSTADSGDINSVSVGFKLGADDNSTATPDGRLDICANEGAGAGNTYGTVPDKTIATFLGSGNVGIGKTDPGSALDVVGDVAISSNLAVDTNTLFVDSVGNKVGIGTNDPDSRLTVLAPNAVMPSLYDAEYKNGASIMVSENEYDVETARSSPNHNSTIILSSDHAHDSGYNAGGSIGFAAKNAFGGYTVQYGQISGVREGSFYGGLSFSTMHNLNDGKLREDMRIINGNVGIGTASPQQILHLQTDTNYDGITLRDSTRELLKIAKGNNGSYINMFESSVSKVNISTGGDTYFTGGNVGIGTASPLSKLEVGDATYSPSGNAPGSITLNGTGATKSNGGKPGLYHRANVGLGLWSDATMTMEVHGASGTPLEAMRIKGDGTVGIGTASPAVKFDVHVGTAAYQGIQVSTTNNGYAKLIGNAFTGGHNRIVRDGDLGIVFSPDNNATSAVADKGFYIAPWATGPSGLRINDDGNVGIGTATPNVPLRVHGGSAPAFASQWLNWLTNYNINTTRQGEVYPMTQLPGSSAIGIYSQHAIGCQTYLFSQGGGLTGSDVRIKKDIIDIDDGEALRILRLLQPKQYKYKDELDRGVDPVWGFIAQEVAEVLPYSVKLQTEYIPNIMEIVEVSNSNIITFSNFNTSNLESNAASLRIRTFEALEHHVKIVEIIDENTIRVDDDLTPYLRSLDETGNLVIETTTHIITPEEYTNLDDIEKNEYTEESNTYVKTSNSYIGNELFIFGQEVDNFNFLKKESIFTITTTALQEVDRLLQAETAKVATLNTQLTSVLARLDALESA